MRRRRPRAPSIPGADRLAADRPVALAAVAGAHGVTGEVRLKLFTEDLSPYRTLDAGGRALTLAAVRPVPSGAVARFAEVTTRDAAEALRGTLLTVPRSALPPLGEGEYYHADLLGLTAITTDGEELGTVVTVDNFGAGDVIEIERPDGRRFMVPMQPAAVPCWNEQDLTVDRMFVA